MTSELLLQGGQFLGGAPFNPPMIPADNQNNAIAADHQNQEELTRRQKARRGILAKFDSVYDSVHALEIISNLLNDAHSYMETVSHDFEKKGVDSRLQLPCDCIKMAIDGITQHGSIISQAIENSSDTKQVQYAQRKLTKSKRARYESQLNHRGVMARNPKIVLASSMDYAKENLDGIITKMRLDFVIVKPKSKKRKRTSDADYRAEGTIEQQESLKTMDVIDLPRPMDGSQFSPIETVAFICNIIDNNPGREYLRAYKDKMISEKLVPIKKTQLNWLVKQYGGTGKPVAPLKWNERGAREAGWERLMTKFKARQDEGGSWSINDTRDVLMAVAVEDKRKLPVPERVNAHHKTLILLHKRRNHINEQILIQERRLAEKPPKLKPKKQSPHPLIRFNKNDPKYASIALPPLSEGQLLYTPAETVTHIMNFIESKPTPDRTQIRLFKEKMMAEKIIPISVSQLNTLIQKHGGPGNKPAPKCWNEKGAREIISIEELTKLVNDSEFVWGIENTRQAVWTRKKEKKTKDGKNVENVKPPEAKTVNAYHTALLSIPEIAHKVIKPEIVRIKPGPKPKNFLDV